VFSNDYGCFKVVDGLQFSKKENNKVNEKMIEEKADRMA